MSKREGAGQLVTCAPEAVKFREPTHPQALLAQALHEVRPDEATRAAYRRQMARLLLLEAVEVMGLVEGRAGSERAEASRG